MTEMFGAVRRSSLGIGIFAIVTAGVIAVTQVATKDKIESNIAEAEAKALYEILPRSIDDKLHEHRVPLTAPELGLSQSRYAWQAIVDGEVRGIIMPVVAPDGYSGDIGLLVGLNRDGSVAGVRVTSHKETPGLGDKIEPAKSNWLENFVGQSMDGNNDSSWAVKKDGGRFDQFTGATITPRAVVNATGRAIQYFRAHQAQLLTPVADHKGE
ncbi:Electron transport complex protein RnfG [Marinobacterium lacunae]|uniref:Ion-translocating oxidoreductase complex subunit G n=1 Tax=Marinobacterium lacunae TaxID=1232683 RepID=A0A081G4P6_9GAMM|nr:electron transport complex subunit RsxG [Marinobacterium lacunae]KEA65751.1 Electron transport complex protein RnfG [Marinobacterium lacunae]MBR9885569.1 electron transport complex subunit RsxG [Oceanospirillales bacterium]